MASEVQALPGFGEFLERDVDRAGAKDLTAKEYTAVRIRKDYPGTYQAVARALFFYKLPVKTCADLFRMNSQCVAAIRDQVIAASSTDGAAAFLVNSRRHSQRDIVLARLTEAIAEKLSDEDAVEKMSVADLTSLLERLERAPAARNGTDARRDDAARTDVTIVDASAFDDVLNGLDPAKKSAASESASDTVRAGSRSPNPATDCSTSSAARTCNSVGLSNIHSISAQKEDNSAEFDEVCNSLCNSLCNVGDLAGAPELDESPATARDLNPPHGAGGSPPPTQAGGSTNNTSDDTQGGES